MDLNPVSQLVTGQTASAPTTKNLIFPDLLTESPRKKIRRLGVIGILGGMLLGMLLSILGGAFSNLDNNLGSFVGSLSNLGALVTTIGIGLLIYSRFLPKAQSTSNSQQYNAVASTDPQLQMPPAQFGQKVSSVTENTTELLEPEEDHARVRR